MKRSSRKWLAICGTALLCATSSVVVAQSMASRILNSLDRGLWELRSVGSGPSRAAKSRVCVGAKMRLVQIQHGNAQCRHRVLSEKNSRVTVSYICPGQGQGVTTIRKETDSLVQINSQGIRNGAPFNFTVEGRRIGGC